MIFVTVYQKNVRYALTLMIPCR